MGNLSPCLAPQQAGVQSLSGSLTDTVRHGCFQCNSDAMAAC